MTRKYIYIVIGFGFNGKRALTYAMSKHHSAEKALDATWRYEHRWSASEKFRRGFFGNPTEMQFAVQRCYNAGAASVRFSATKAKK